MVAPVVMYAAVPVSVIVALGILRRLRARRWGRCMSETCLRGKTYIVTGATSGVGLATARALVKRKARVIFAVRDVDRAKKIIEEIRRVQPTGGEMISMHLDLSSLDSIESFVELIRAGFYKIDVLINNAGVAVPIELDLKTKDGFEINMGVNHLGHFHLTNLLLDRLKKASPSSVEYGVRQPYETIGDAHGYPGVLSTMPAGQVHLDAMLGGPKAVALREYLVRVVIVSSTLHEKGVIKLDDLNMIEDIKRAKQGQRSGRHSPGYNNSKLMNVYFARELSERWRDYGIDVHACCPGWTYTNLFRYSVRWYHYIMVAPIAFFFMRSAEQGAQTVIFCATDYSVEGKTGKFYKDCAEYLPNHKFDEDIQRKLWAVTEDMIKARKPL